MRQPYLLAGLAAAAIFIASCSSNPSDPGRLTGNLHGRIQLQTECGMTEDHSGVTVKIEGTSFAAVTDAKGRWEIKSLPAGTYVIEYSKQGYVTHRRESFQFVGGGEAYVSGSSRAFEAYILGLPTWTISGLQASIVMVNPDSLHERAQVRVTGNVTASSCDARTPRIAYIFVSDKSTVSSSDYKEMFQVELYGETPTLFELPSHAFTNGGFQKGTTVHIIAYPAGAVNQMNDPDTQKVIFEGLGSTPSNVASFVMP